MSSDTRKFFVGLTSQDGMPRGHVISSSPINFDADPPKASATRESDGATSNLDPNDTFLNVFDRFVSDLEGYRRFISLTLTIAPELARAVAERQIFEFVRSNGVNRPDLSGASTETYELDFRFFAEFWSRSEQVTAAMEGAKLLPPIMIVGLVSSYDAFLASLLKCIFLLKQEIVLTSQKQLTFKELLEFASIESARSTLIDREVESILRKSHHEQFEWMQSHLDVKLKKDLDVWPKFIELCERRNLFTHTGGFVSEQYLKNCRDHGASTKNISIGDRLAVESEYFTEAIETVYEIGLKLCYVLWRKFRASENELADSSFNYRCMTLIEGRSYKLAQSLLKFSCAVPRIKGETRLNDGGKPCEFRSSTRTTK